MSTSQDMFLDEPAVTPEVIGVADAKLGALRLGGQRGRARLRRTSTFTDLGSMTTTATMGTITTATRSFRSASRPPGRSRPRSSS